MAACGDGDLQRQPRAGFVTPGRSREGRGAVLVRVVAFGRLPGSMRLIRLVVILSLTLVPGSPGNNSFKPSASGLRLRPKVNSAY